MTWIKGVSTLLLSMTWISACGGVFGPPEKRAATRTASAIDSIAAQTLEALRTTEEPGKRPSPELLATLTALPPTATPLPTSTPWPVPVRIEVSIDTNCRSGPGPNFPLIGALMVGESTIVRARLLEADYWIVENPDNPGRECWLWGRHATLDGDASQLPIATPPWTATPEPGTIAGWAFIDTNSNAVRDIPGDLPLDGLSLILRVGNCPGGTGAAMVDTDPEGRYVISDLIPTLYCLSHQGDSAIYPNTWTINLSPGQVREDINFWRAP